MSDLLLGPEEVSMSRRNDTVGICDAGRMLAAWLKEPVPRRPFQHGSPLLCKVAKICAATLMPDVELMRDKNRNLVQALGLPQACA
jgi:hypothetical protein